MAAFAEPGQLQTLPEPQTDFVFTVTGDAWLLLYALIAAIVAGLLVWRYLRARGSSQ